MLEHFDLEEMGFDEDAAKLALEATNGGLRREVRREVRSVPGSLEQAMQMLVESGAKALNVKQCQGAGGRG